jgi:hypothetical protein
LNSTRVINEYTYAAPRTTKEKQRTTISPPPRLAAGQLDQRLLTAAIEILTQFPVDDEIDSTNRLAALRGYVGDLWQSASTASHIHQGILAIIERLLTNIDSLTADRASLVLEGLRDLQLHRLTDAHIEMIRSRAVDAGSNPLLPFGDYSDDGLGNG